MLYPLAGGSAGAGNYAVALPSCKGKGRHLDCLPSDIAHDLPCPAEPHLTSPCRSLPYPIANVPPWACSSFSIPDLSCEALLQTL
jgi:hypothetical protein